MDADVFQPVLDKLMLLKNDWPHSAWTWDDRFTMLASAFTKEQEGQARASTVRALDYVWDSTTVSTAPGGLRAICERTGGLRKGQLVMAGKAGPLVLVGLWWPWRGGEQITLRLGLGEYEADEDPYPQVRELFGVKR